MSGFCTIFVDAAAYSPARHKVCTGAGWTLESAGTGAQTDGRFEYSLPMTDVKSGSSCVAEFYAAAHALLSAPKGATIRLISDSKPVMNFLMPDPAKDYESGPSFRAPSIGNEKSAAALAEAIEYLRLAAEGVHFDYFAMDEARNKRHCNPSVVTGLKTVHKLAGDAAAKMEPPAPEKTESAAPFPAPQPSKKAICKLRKALDRFPSLFGDDTPSMQPA